MRCYYCGHTVTHVGETNGEDPTIVEDATGMSGSSGLSELSSLVDKMKPQELTCPGCAAPMQVTMSNDGDKGAVCTHCGHEIDLPERHGVKRRRTLRDGGRTDVIEESVWTEETCRRIPTSEEFDDSDDGDETPLPGSEESEITIKFDGDTDDPEAFARFLREVKDQLPPGQAKTVIREVKRVMRRRE